MQTTEVTIWTNEVTSHFGPKTTPLGIVRWERTIGKKKGERWGVEEMNERKRELRRKERRTKGKKKKNRRKAKKKTPQKSKQPNLDLNPGVHA